MRGSFKNGVQPKVEMDDDVDWGGKTSSVATFDIDFPSDDLPTCPDGKTLHNPTRAITPFFPRTQSTSFPEQLGKHQVLLPIGMGATATVFVARTPTFESNRQEVAIKLFHPHILCGDPLLRRRILREERLLSLLRHRNVVSLIDVGDDAQGFYLVMEYIEGGTLSLLLRTMTKHRGVMPLPIVIRIIVDMLEGLQGVHDASDASGQPVDAVHRDVCPSNVMVDLQGRTRLIDLGIAKVHEWTQMTGRNTLGKVPYLAPEQLLGNTVDRRCDIWSAGITLWEMLTGRQLYPGTALHSLVERLRSPPPKVGSIRGDIPIALDAAISSALVLDREARYSSAKEFGEHLEAASQGVGVATEEEVGSFVKEWMGPDLMERSRIIEQLIEYRRMISEIETLALIESADETDTLTQEQPVRKEWVAS